MRCKPGYHYVRSHRRLNEDGSKSAVAAHCRRNSGAKAKHLFATNLDYLFRELKDTYPAKKLKRIKGFDDQGQYDEVVQFWLDYWKDQKLIDFDIDPLLIKAVIAVESSFKEQVITKLPNSSATGLMQVTKSTMTILARRGEHREIRSFPVEITQEEAQTANSNIAAGTRWLIHKISSFPARNKAKTPQEKMLGGLKYYHSWNSEGEAYAKKVWKLYEASK